MKLKGLWGASMVLVAMAASSCDGEQSAPLPELTPATVRTTRQEANSVRKVLILGSTVSGGLQSQEARAVLNLPLWQVEVVTPEQWKLKTAEQFMSYRALVIGDAACTPGTAAFQAAVDTRATWGAIVDGNVVVIGSNPATNSWSATSGELDPLVQGGIEFAVERPRLTGMYVALGCAYRAAAAATPVQLLSPFGHFEVAGVGCAESGHVPSQFPATFTQYLFDGLLTGQDGCAAKTVFTTYPQNDFSIGSLALDSTGTMPGSQPYYDYDFGETFPGTPFILTRGATASGFGCGGDSQNIPSDQECDLGDGANGQPVPVITDPPQISCSWACKSEWCGDGVVQPHLGEQCDLGGGNGRDDSGNISNGKCSGMCRTVAIPSVSPPVAVCKNVSVTVTNVCGTSASIDDGSFDPDNDLVGCTQSPAAPYNIGSRTVTLTCTDAKAKVATCTGTVNVLDGVVPTIALNGAASMALECGVGSYTELNANANDLCAGDMTPAIVKKVTLSGNVVPSVTNKPTGVYTVNYSVKDAANNSAQVNRTVTVSDTGKPIITLTGLANQPLECGVAYNEQGATVVDQCASIPPTAVVRGGSVNNRVLATYPLTYDVTDPSGNAADRKTRLVTVRDTTPPSVTLPTGTANVNVECADPNFAHPPVDVTDTCFSGPFTVTRSREVNLKLLGGQGVIYSAKDGANNTGSSPSRTFTVRDTLQPSLTLLGDSAVAIECGNPFNEPGATANDQCAGILTPARSGALNTDVPNTYTLSYKVSDGQTGDVVANRTVTVSDTLAPVVTVTGGGTAAVECGGSYTEQGATALDKCAGPLTTVAAGQVQSGTPGTYTLTYTATDPGGRAGTGTRVVTVADNLNPVISLNSPSSSQLECGTAYADPTTASDQCAGNLTAQMQTTGNVNHQQPGNYPVGYTVADPSGKTASASRTVSVRDTLAPSVTMTGSPTAELECGTGPFPDPGATANDACAGQLTPVPTVVVDQRAPGTYTINYRATDPSGNTGVAAGSRTVTVRDTQEPVMALNGNAVQALECGTQYNELGATASDTCRGPLPVTTTGGVNHMAPATYTLDYRATDGTFTKQVSRTVNVSDTQAPSLDVLGSPTDSYECGSTYVDQGATAADACAGNLTAAIKTETRGDPTRPGTVFYDYRVKDPTGNERFVQGARTVTVNDNAPPVLVRTGQALVSLECGDDYADLGATANDACFGDVTSRIVTTNTVNKDAPADYTVRYNVTDQAGQSAPEVTRTVRVSDTQPPTVTVIGPLSETLECGNGVYQDPGATGVDACAATVTVTASTVVDQNAPGGYTITYTGTDPSGNSATAATSRSVTVADTLAPVLVLNGPGNSGLECGTPYNELGATASDLCRGNLTASIQRNGDVDHMTPATYAVSYTVTDGQLSDSETRTVTVSDTLLPSLTVLGPATDTFECGSTYVDPGATASDVCDGDLTARIQTTPRGDANQPGTVFYDYSVTDDSGLKRTVVGGRTVTVNDNEPPVMVLNGPNTLGLECGAEYSEPGAVANDACFGNVTSRIRIDGEVITTTPGNYTLTYNVTDQAGRSAPQLLRAVNVTDTVAPSITVLPPFAQAFECGTGPYTDPGATASDTCAGNLTAAIETTGQVLPGTAGAYTLSYSVTDPSGNQITAAQTRSVTVQDTQAPQIALVGPAVQGFECGTPYSDPGATANDACAGNLTGAIVTTGAVDENTAGPYTLTYRVTDPSGLSAQTSRQVNVSDTLPPTLTLVGASPQVVECKGQYADPGAQASDLCAGDLTAAIQKTGAVDPAVVGPYTVTYNVSDPSGRAAPPVTRDVTVRDSLVPSIAVNGPLSQQHECGSTYMDPGATANDQCAGDLTAAIVATPTGNPNTPGAFEISYRVTDPSGNTVTSPVTRTVTVNDTSAPVLALIGPATVGVECGSPYNDQGATASDACYGNLTPEMTGAVNVNQPNSYTLVFNVTDPSGQIAPAVTRTVNVTDTQVPSITVVGPLQATFECGQTYQDPGATANDTCAGNLTSQVVSQSTPVPGQPGTVSISYSVTDPSGNTATSAVSRTVRMIDEAAPVVSLIGAPTVAKECGTPYVDPGATANDTCVGPLPVTVTGAVDHTTAGSYTLTYTAKDLVDNVGTATRTVTVSDTQGPVIALNGASPTVLECNVDTWMDPGAVATDLCSGAKPAVASGAVNTAVVGAYLVTYNAQDNSNNSAVPVIRNVLVQDNLDPVITLNGPNPMVLECALGNLDNDPLVKIIDACFGDTSHTAFREFTNLNINQVGSYIARYQGDDTRGNVVQIERDLTVVDTTAPVLEVLSAGETVECGTQPSLGVRALDACYGPVPVIATPASLPNEPGEYTVTYSAVDPAGNIAGGSGSVSRTITVEDTTEPVLSIADQDVFYECTGYAIGNVWNAPEATATDLCEGSLLVHQYNTGDDDEDGLPGSIDPDDFGPGPTTEVEGLYYVQYLAWDETYNIQGAILSVYVRDTIKPVLWLNEDNDGGDPAYEQVECFLPRDGLPPDPNPYQNPGASAEDQCYGDLNQEVVSFREVNKQVPGIYTLSYQVRDGAFNWAEELTRTVEVIDSQQPTTEDRNASLKPSDGTMRNVELSECAVAEDRCEGYLPINLNAGVTNITSNEPGDDAGDIIFTQGESSFQLRAEANPGSGGRSYTVEYTVSDSSGNATSATCVIRVPPPPRVASPANGAVSTTNRPTYSGTAEPGTTISVIVDNLSVGTTQADAAGNWSFTQLTALANGAHTVRALSTDGLGNNSSSTTNIFTVQTTLAGR